MSEEDAGLFFPVSAQAQDASERMESLAEVKTIVMEMVSAFEREGFTAREARALTAGIYSFHHKEAGES